MENMKEYKVAVVTAKEGYYTITFDSLREAERYVNRFFEDTGIVLGIEEIQQ